MSTRFRVIYIDTLTVDQQQLHYLARLRMNFRSCLLLSIRQTQELILVISGVLRTEH
jgi:hypothetical protein